MVTRLTLEEAAKYLKIGKSTIYRFARKKAALARSLQDKLETQKVIKALEKTRNTKRRELFDV